MCVCLCVRLCVCVYVCVCVSTCVHTTSMYVVLVFLVFCSAIECVVLWPPLYICVYAISIYYISYLLYNTTLSTVQSRVKVGLVSCLTICVCVYTDTYMKPWSGHNAELRPQTANNCPEQLSSLYIINFFITSYNTQLVYVQTQTFLPRLYQLAPHNLPLHVASRTIACYGRLRMPTGTVSRVALFTDVIRSNALGWQTHHLPQCRVDVCTHVC